MATHSEPLVNTSCTCVLAPNTVCAVHHPGQAVLPFYASGRATDYRRATAGLIEVAINHLAQANARLESGRLDQALDLMSEVLNDIT